MSRARVQLQPAWILARRDYRESSLLLEVFSRERGRVGLVARGVKGARSARSALLQPLRPLLLSWSEGAELGTLASAEPADAAVALAGEQLFCAWYLNELLLALLPRNDPHPPLYDRYSESLKRLAAEPVQPVLRGFELQLLADLGYGVHFPEDLDPSLRYVHAAEEGILPLAADAPGGYGGRTLIALRDGTLAQADAQSLSEARKLLRALLRPLLGGKELQTPRLLRELRRHRENEPQASDD